MLSPYIEESQIPKTPNKIEETTIEISNNLFMYSKSGKIGVLTRKNIDMNQIIKRDIIFVVLDMISKIKN